MHAGSFTDNAVSFDSFSCYFLSLYTGKKTVKLEISSKQNKAGNLKKVKRSLTLSGMEFKLDKLRKELSSCHGTTPHAVLSAQQISVISAQKPNSAEEASS